MPVNVFDLAGIDLGLPTGLGVSLARRAPAYYSPEEQQSLLGSLLNTGLSGIGMAADVLDTLGGPVRTALAGNWENVLPSIVDPSLRTSGRDMLQNWGLVEQNTPGLDWGDVWGVGAEIATDPLSYFSPLGLTKAGKLAKSAGLLDDLARVAPTLGKREGRVATTLEQLMAPRVGEAQADFLSRVSRAEQAAAGMGVSLDSLTDQPLGALAAGGPLGAYLGTGNTSRAIARGVDTVGSWLRYGNIPGTNISPGRTLGALFSAPAGEATSRVGQETVMPAAFEARRQAGMAARGDVAEAVGELKRAGYAGETLDDKRMLRRLVEGVDAPGTPEYTEAISRLRQMDDNLIQEAADWGVSKKLNDPEAQHFYRFLTRDAEKLPKGAGGAKISDFDQSALARNEFTVGIEGGTDTLMRIATDPQVQQIHSLRGGLTKSQRADELQKIIKAKFPEVPLEYAPKALQQKGQPPVLKDRVKDLSEWLLRMPEGKLKSGIFGNDPITDFAVGRVHAMDRLAGAKTAIQSLADKDLMAKAWKTTNTPGDGIRLGQVLGNKAVTTKGGETIKGMSLNRKAALTKIAELRGMPSPTMKDLKALARELVPRDLAEDLMRYNQAFSGPKAVGQIIKAVDNVNALFRTGVTSIFPAFHTRNFVSGAVNNFIKGLFSPRAMSEASAIIRGQAADVLDIPAVKQMLTERGLAITKENASDMLRELSYASDAVTRHSDEARRMTEFGDLSSLFPGGYSGGNRFSRRESAAKYFGKGEGLSANPLNVRGFGGREKTAFGPAVAGEDFAYYTDGVNRLAGLIAGLRKGRALPDVMRDVDAAQVAYRSKNYTKFEQEVMTRVFPFYKYCVPTDHEILTKRGWKRLGDLRIGEPVMAMNPANGIMEWTPLLAINRFQHDGPMLDLKKKGGHVHFRCTEGHRWVTRRKCSRKTDAFDRFELAANMASKSYAAWQVPTNGEYLGSKKSILSPRLAAILGWVLTDGHCRWRPVVNGKVASRDNGLDGGGCEMVVYQSPSKHLDEIVSLLGTKPRGPHPDTGVVAVPVALEDQNELTKVFQQDSDLPGICAKLSREAAEAMWDAMFKAEGSLLGGRVQSFEQHANTHVKDAFQILCILTGRSGNIHKQGVYVKKRQHYDAAFTRTWFTGEVWCPTTKHGTWMMRHNGCHVITGNSRNAMPFMLEELVENPGGRLGKMLRVQDQVRDEKPGTPDYIRETASIGLGTTPEGADRYITGFGLGYEDPLSFFGGGVRGGLLEVASRMTPVAKLPAEWLTGESFFQKGPGGGREIDDMDPTVGRTVANLLYQAGLRDEQQGEPVQILGNRTASQGLEFVLANSPLARVLSTARTVTDPRKFDVRERQVDPAGLLNLLTGVRVADISPAAQDRVINERADALMQEMGAKTFSETYFPDAAVAAMGQDDQQKVVQFEMLQRMLEQRRRQRRQQQLQQAGGI